MDARESTKALADKGKALGSEFRQFIWKGNIIDMAIGVVIGGAFGKIITSFVSEVIMPPIGILCAKVDFKDLAWTIQAAHVGADGREVKPVVIKYGLFLQSVIDFLIVGLVIFVALKIISKMMKRWETAPAAAAPTTKDCPKCLMAIPIKATKCGHCTVDIV